MLNWDTKKDENRYMRSSKLTIKFPSAWTPDILVVRAAWEQAAFLVPVNFQSPAN